jgi:hypothetical protein
MDRNVCDSWILAVLDVDVTAIAAAAASGKLTPIWTGAKERVDQGFDALQKALRAANDPDLLQLAEYGLNSITDRQSVKLMAALMEADSGGDTRKLVAAINSFRDFLDGSAIVDLLEDNPLGVKVSLRTQLGPALDIIASRIEA